ncbi:GNAT family N-acetyltransferase [Niveibacterium umoris]|nr:GNAT family N-acetyltransferase [Niveibacterium umoris]
MRESLERIGRFDAVRARDRLAASWVPALTRHIVSDGERVGFFMLRRADHALVLQHLYLVPAVQGRGIGSAVMKSLIGESVRSGLPLRVTALRDSPANAFYLRHGFVRCHSEEFDVDYVRAPDACDQASSSR